MRRRVFFAAVLVLVMAGPAWAAPIFRWLEIEPGVNVAEPASCCAAGRPGRYAPTRA